MTTELFRRVALCDLESLGLTYTVQVLHKNNRKKDTKAFPTPYLKDVIAGITNLTTTTI
jgi:hypothetical protein